MFKMIFFSFKGAAGDNMGADSNIAAEADGLLSISNDEDAAARLQFFFLRIFLLFVTFFSLASSTIFKVASFFLAGLFSVFCLMTNFASPSCLLYVLLVRIQARPFLEPFLLVSRVSQWRR